jgi:hypothetical protein
VTNRHQQHPIDLTTDLLRAAIATPSPVAWPQATAATWQRLVAVSSAHLVLQALAPALPTRASDTALPDDLPGFLATFRTANAERNRALMLALRSICAELNEAGVTPVVLKGAAFLLSDRQAAAPWRFMRDLDLLVPAERLDDCVARLEHLGFSPGTRDYDPATEAHYPPLMSPCGLYSIELHTRLFARGEYGLPASLVVSRAAPARARDLNCEVLIPSSEDRLLHALVHAQLHNRNYSTRRIVLKDVLDLSMIAGAGLAPADWIAISDRLSAPGDRIAILSLVEAWYRLMQPNVIEDNPSIFPRTARSWASTAIARLHWSALRSMLQTPLDLVCLEARRYWTEPGHVARRARLLVNPRQFAATAATWSFKQRQRLWG